MLLDVLEIGELLPTVKPRVWFDLFKMLPFCFLFLLFRFCQQYISDCFSQRFLCDRLISSHKSRNILCENFIHGWILNRWICFLKEELLLLTVCRFWAWVRQRRTSTWRRDHWRLAWVHKIYSPGCSWSDEIYMWFLCACGTSLTICLSELDSFCFCWLASYAVDGMCFECLSRISWRLCLSLIFPKNFKEPETGKNVHEHAWSRTYDLSGKMQ